MKNKKTETRKLKDILWQLCRVFSKAKFIKNEKYYCFTCEKEIEGSNCQLGHFIPNSVGGALLRNHPHNLRLQCYYCNINLGGNGSEFYRRLVLEEGQSHVDNLFKLKNKSIKADIFFYENMIELYKRGDEKKIVEYLEMMAQNG